MRPRLSGPGERVWKQSACVSWISPVEKACDQNLPLELAIFCTSGATSVAVRPDRLAGDIAKSVIAVASPLVPALGDIGELPIIPPMVIELGLEPFRPSIIPSDASLIMEVTSADVFAMLSDLAYCDMAAS